ncbi:MAG TPA: dihydropteroate synthase [Nitrospiraceae bacterium]
MPPSPDHPAPILLMRGRRLVLDRPLVMGVLNVTPDSFSDGGLYLDPGAAVKHALEMVDEGADLIDIGAESSRPGAEPVSEAEELSRLVPVVQEVCRRVTVPVSVDTTKAAVARQALDAGAAIINDISALLADPAMAGAVAKAGAGLVLMHMQGTPQTMQRAPRYGDIVAEVREFLRARMQAAVEAGIAAGQILLDPGIGFGKNLEQNLILLDRLDAFQTLGRPILVGVSRKAFIGEVLGRRAGDRLLGTAAAVAAAVLRGAGVVRVHDVRAMQDVVRVIDAIQKHRPR